VSDEDKHLPSPFTQAPTASLIFEKEKQAKERAVPPGQSKLRKFRQKREPPADKVVMAAVDMKSFNEDIFCIVLMTSFVLIGSDISGVMIHF